MCKAEHPDCYQRTSACKETSASITGVFLYTMVSLVRRWKEDAMAFYSDKPARYGWEDVENYLAQQETTRQINEEARIENEKHRIRTLEQTVEHIIEDASEIVVNDPRFYEKVENWFDGKTAQIQENTDAITELQEYRPKVRHLEDEINPDTTGTFGTSAYTSKIFINALDYGFKNDGSTDNRSVADALMGSLGENSATVYFPAGQYNFNSPFIIPDNVHIVGDGRATKFYGNYQTSFWGVVIAVVGSNVTLENISVGYRNDDRAFQSGSNDGGIGITGAEYADALNNVRTAKATSNVQVRNLYSESTYPIQTETEDLTGLTYDGIYAPNGVVSIRPMANNAIKCVNVSNVVCGLFRCGLGYKIDANVTNMVCNYLQATGSGSNYANIAIIGDADSRAHSWGGLTTLLYCCSGIKFDNVTINGNNAVATGIHQIDGSNTENPTYYTNVTMMNVATTTVNMGTVTKKPVLVNCDFSNTTGTGTFNATAIACKLGSINETATGLKLHADSHLKKFHNAYLGNWSNMTSAASPGITQGSFVNTVEYFAYTQSVGSGTAEIDFVSLQAEQCPDSEQTFMCMGYLRSDASKKMHAIVATVYPSGKITLKPVGADASWATIDAVIVNGVYIVSRI